jgi:rhodanese-related sulfurtransferase
MLVLSLGAVAVLGCSDDDDGGPVTTPPDAVDEFRLVTELGDQYFTDYTTPSGQPVNVGASAVWTNLTADADAYHILDWRSAAHFALGHIEGAINVSAADIDAVVAAVPEGATVLNVCYTGQAASHATAYMNMLGIEAQNLKFGMCGWTSEWTDGTTTTLDKWDVAISDDYAGWLVEEAFTATETYDFPVLDTGEGTAEDILIDRAHAYMTAGWKTMNVADLYTDIEVNGNGDDYFIVNYFNAPQYDAGHIPGAVRFQPNEDFRADEMLAYLPTDRKVVVYCFTGQTSSQVVAYLNAIGYDAYSLMFGVNAMCASDGDVCTTPWHAPDTDYPVVP